MPWKVSTSMSLKLEFTARCLAEDSSISSLCRSYGISRNTAYKLLKRFKEDGVDGLIDKRTCRPVRSKQYEKKIWDTVAALRNAHPTYGPRKLLKILRNQSPDQVWPSASLIKKYLRDTGLSQPRIIRRKIVSERLPLRDYDGLNSIWCMDRKGSFRTADGLRCDPFTLLDGASRYLLACTPIKPAQFAQVKVILEKAFHEYGLPLAIRSDNGTPFGSSGLRGLTPLSVWLLKIGIWTDKTTPGCPGENGRLERLHRTLKEDALSGPPLDYASYASHFDEFRHTYNTLRPHDSLGEQTPSQVYSPSPRVYVPDKVYDYAYPADYKVLKVDGHGYLRLPETKIYLSESLAKECVGLGPETESGRPLLFLGYPLGYVEEHYSRLRKQKV